MSKGGVVDYANAGYITDGEAAAETEAAATPKPRAGEHTKGPWRGGKARLHFEGDREVLAIFDRGEAPLATFPDVSDAEANARRIVVCVNACEAMDDPDAEIADVMENVRLLRIERDLLRERERELLEALRLAAFIPNGAGAEHFMAVSNKCRDVLSRITP